LNNNYRILKTLNMNHSYPDEFVIIDLKMER